MSYALLILASIIVNTTAPSYTRTSLGGGAHVLGNVDCTLSRSGEFLLALSEAGKISIWDPGSRRIIVECESEGRSPKGYSGIKYPATPAKCACFDSSNEKRVFFCNTRGVHVWEWGAKKEPACVFASKEFAIGNEVICGERMAVSEDGTTIAITFNWGALVVLDIPKQKANRFSTGRELSDDWWDYVSFLDSTKVMFNGGDCVNVLDLKMEKVAPLLSLDAKQGEFTFVVSGKPGKSVLASHKNGELRLWDMETLKSSLFHSRKGSSRPFAMSFDSKMIALEEDTTSISVYAVQNKKKVSFTPEVKGGCTAIGFLHDNDTIFFSGEFPEIRFWSISKKMQLESGKK